MTLKLYNTLTKTKEVFTPLDPQNVRMYVCGPTVYDFAHIGNARPVIVFDVLFRLLRHLYGERHVKYVRNITDVDDKINARAAERGISIRELTEETYANFRADTLALGCLPPTVEPRATEHIAQMISMIERLIAAGHAYAAQGHVLFDVASKPDYGKLARRSLDEMVAGARVEIAPYKKNPMDFVLWKPSTDDLPGWESPWGRGRPGWHIECSAMSECHLGETFDIHGGGIDLVFPHHENEIAQSEAAHHGHRLANIWMHNGFLQVEGQKMSKSLGNFVTIREMYERGWKGYFWPAEAVRFNLLRTHYRQPLDWSFEGLDEAHKILWEWAKAVDDLVGTESVASEILNALSDDLNFPQVIAELHSLRRHNPAALVTALKFLGFSCRPESLQRSVVQDRSVVIRPDAAQLRLSGKEASVTTTVSEEEIEELIVARSAARKAKNFAESDRIRNELDKMGVVLKDGPDGTTWELKR